MYQLDDVRTVVRSKVQGLSLATYPDARLDAEITQAKRRLDVDRPAYAAALIAGTGSKWYKMTGLSGWVDDFSTISQIYYPAPVVANNDDITVLGAASYRGPMLISDGEYLHVYDTLETGKNALVEYTVPWQVIGVDAGTTTTLPSRFRNALEFLACAFVCESLSARSANSLDPQIPGEMVNWRNKYQEYQIVALQFRKEYYKEIGVDPDTQPPAAVRGSYPSVDQLNRSWMTHRRAVPGSRTL